jgi:tRNA(Ile)-lysidine synthase
MLRGKESDEDENYITELCSKLGIPLHVKAYNINEISKTMKISLEEAGREVRYKEFESFASSVGASKIAVAHNKNDQAETIIMRIIRGTGLDGLKGMGHRRDNVIRPLLDIDRKEIEAYCVENSLHPRIDSSNLESIYTRNRIRLELIPGINNMFDTDIVESIYRMSLLLRDDYELIEKNVLDIYSNCVEKKGDKSITLNLNKLMECTPAAYKRIFRISISEIKGDLKGIENIHIECITDLMLHGGTGSVLHLPEGLRVKKSYTSIVIYTKIKEEALCFDEIVKVPGRTIIKALQCSFDAELETYDSSRHIKNSGDSLEQIFDYEKLKTGINIRNRRIGDSFKPLNSIGTKKLKEYFIDQKIPREERGGIPLVAKNNEIVWIVGYKISDKFKVTENTKSILKLKYNMKNM